MGPRSMTPAGSLRPPNLGTHPTADGAMLSNQQKPRARVLDDAFANGEENSADSKLQEATNNGKKASSFFLSFFLITIQFSWLVN